MTDTITLTGLIATVPRHVVTSGNLPITSFRLASTQRRYDRAQGQWVDAETNWYTVSAFRQLAFNSAQSLQKGDRVVVTGRVRLRDWATSEKSGTTVDIEADALGHDLTWGTASWRRTSSSSGGASGVVPGTATPSAGDSGVTEEDPRTTDGRGLSDGDPGDRDQDLARDSVADDTDRFATEAETPF